MLERDWGGPEDHAIWDARLQPFAFGASPPVSCFASGGAWRCDDPRAVDEGGVATGGLRASSAIRLRVDAIESASTLTSLQITRNGVVLVNTVPVQPTLDCGSPDPRVATVRIPPPP